MDGSIAFQALREAFLGAAADPSRPPPQLHWPEVRHFNWAQDYFDLIARNNPRPALRVVDDAGGDEVLSFATLAERSHRVANFLAAHGVGPRDRVLVMLGNVVPLWETMLAAIKLSAVMIPATTLPDSADLRYRFARGRVRHLVATARAVAKFDGLDPSATRITAGNAPAK